MSVIWTIILPVIVAALSVSASVHAIMTRREVGTAVAWVGVIWLSPIIGALLYFLLGVNRIKRRAQELRGADEESYRDMLPPAASLEAIGETLGPDRAHLLPVARLGDTVTERPLLPGNLVEPLIGGEKAFPAMIAAIERAERTISLVSFIFDNDRAGQHFLEALVAARDRGVEVRVLIDDVGARYSFPSMVGEFRKADIRVARFMPALFHWRMPYFNLRNHRKVMVVDGRVGFTGGMNIRESYWDDLTGRDDGDDLHFRITGPVVAELQEVFALDWTFTTRERLVGEEWFPPLTTSGETVARGIADGPDVDYEKLLSTILGAISVARDTIHIITPYFIPDQRLLSALGIAARRGVEVVIILPRNVNLALVQWASTAYWHELLEYGCRIVVTPPPFDHTKLMVVDAVWTLLGSSNLDPRSLQLNFEFNVECYDPVLAGTLTRLIEERLEVGSEVTLEDVRQRAFYLKFRDRLARLFSPYL